MKTPSSKIMSISEMIRENLRMLRNTNNLSQENMATIIGMGASAYAKLEEGITKIHVEVLQMIASAFNKDIHFFLGAPNKDQNLNGQADKIIIDTLTLRIEDLEKKIREYENELQ